jgi:hypothetical protein
MSWSSYLHDGARGSPLKGSLIRDPTLSRLTHLCGEVDTRLAYSMPEIAEKQTDIVDFLWRNDVVPGPAPGDCGVDAVWSKLPNYPYRLGIFAVRHHPRFSRRSF